MSYLKWIIHLYLAVSMGTGFLISCSPVEFNRDTSNCGGLGQAACAFTPENAYVKFDYDYSVPQPAVDVLFVIDTSSSMIAEHAKMAERFNAFIASIQGLNWQIAVTSMDISNDPQYHTAGQVLNPKSYFENSRYAYMRDYQDGNLIPDISGRTILRESEGSTQSLQERFDSMISIDAKLGPNNENYFSRGDERGIFTAALAIDKYRNQFVRPDAHLAIVFLTDEDVRGEGLGVTFEKKKPTERDLPTYLASVIQNQLGQNKKVSIYPIIIESEDPNRLRLPDGQVGNCLQQQNAQGSFNGKVGYMYEDLLDFYPGGTASICAPNYTQLLSNIGNDIELRTRDSIELPCTPIIDPEKNLDVVVTGLPEASRFEVIGKSLRFTPALLPGAEIRLSYSCTDI